MAGVVSCPAPACTLVLDFLVDKEKAAYLRLDNAIWRVGNEGTGLRQGVETSLTDRLFHVHKFSAPPDRGLGARPDIGGPDI